MRLDIISYVGMEINRLLLEGKLNKETVGIVFDTLSNARINFGGKTVYIQNLKVAWQIVYFAWETIYKIQVENKFISKQEVAVKIKDLILTQTRLEYETSTIMSMLTDTNIKRMAKELKKREGIVEDYIVEDNGLFSHLF